MMTKVKSDKNKIINVSDNIGKKVLIVLCGGMTDAGQVNVRSKIRCDAAVLIHHKFDFILTTTGRTYRRDEENISEARCLANYLISLGVPSSKIMCEEKSKDTFSNAFYSRVMLDEIGVTDLTVLTNKFHMKRTRLLFGFVFGGESGYRLRFISCANPPFTVEQERNHLAHEKIICAFYRKNLVTSYGLIAGDIEKLKWFMEKVNPAMCGVSDVYHLQLTADLNARVAEKKLGY